MFHDHIAEYYQCLSLLLGGVTMWQCAPVSWRKNNQPVLERRHDLILGDDILKLLPMRMDGNPWASYQIIPDRCNLLRLLSFCCVYQTVHVHLDQDQPNWQQLNCKDRNGGGHRWSCSWTCDCVKTFKDECGLSDSSDQCNYYMKTYDFI